MNRGKRLLLTFALGMLVRPVWAGEHTPPMPALEPEQAFRLKAERAENGDIELTYVVAQGHYLYRDRFKLASQGKEIPRTALKWPPGKHQHDSTFGDVVVYRDSVRLLVPSRSLMVADKKRGVVELFVTSQGCADAGICYPPVRQIVTLQPGQRVATLSALETGFGHSSSAAPPLASKLIKPRSVN